MPTSLFTQQFRTDAIRRLIADFSDRRYYFFYSKYTPWPDESDPPDVTRAPNDEFFRPWREAYYGKRVLPTNVRPVFRRVDWVSGTQYDAYDDAADLSSLDFVVVTDERKVYKCLEAGPGDSTSKPVLTANTPFTLGDGYVWKYMFTVDVATESKHATDSLYPIVANAAIEDAAANGSIEVVRVVDSGNNWLAVHQGSVTQTLSPSTFRIALDASTTNGTYVGSGFCVLSGNGVGGLSRITSHHANGSGVYVVVNPSLPNTAFGDTYLISPCVNAVGDGTGFRAYSTVDANTKRVDRVVVLSSGSGYSKATIQLTAAAGVSNTDYDVRAVLSPPGGHGSDPFDEVLAEGVSIYGDVQPGDACPDGADIRVVGIVVDPEAQDGEAYADEEFVGYYLANAAYAVSSPEFQADEVVTSGQKSATVLFANATHVAVADAVGTFVDGDTLVGATSGATADLTVINTPQVRKASGRVVYVNHAERVIRAPTGEQLRVTLRI